MNVKLIDFIDIITYNERLKVYDKNNCILFLGNKNHILSLLYKKQVFATKKIIGFMVYKDTISINTDYEKITEEEYNV
jgi:hypothetical protein